MFKYLLTFTFACSALADIEIKSDMPENMTDWVAERLFKHLTEGYKFKNISGIMISDLSAKYGGQWVSLDGTLQNFPKHFISPNTTIRFDDGYSGISFYQLNYQNSCSVS